MLKRFVLGNNKRRWIWILSILAGLRVFVFAAAFPLFNNVDEPTHVDLILKYSHAERGGSLPPFDQETAYYFALYGSPEYFSEPARGEVPEPMWRQPRTKIAERLNAVLSEWKNYTNYETGEPPLYYSLAASLWKLGSLLHVRPGPLLYLVRFLNVAVIAALVWLGYFATRVAFPQNKFMEVAVPALIAFFPQDTFYCIESDVLSPLFFGVAFIGLIRFFQSNQPSSWTAIYTGLALSAACLSKTANLPLLIFSLIVVAVRIWQVVRSRNFRRHSLAFITFGGFALVPTAAWMVWNYRCFGDLTGASGKISYWGWTVKPVAEWWSHPLFSPAGLYTFWHELLSSFWHGEIFWHGQQLSGFWANWFYWASSTFVLAIAAASLLKRTKWEPPDYSVLLSLLSLFSAIAFVAAISLAFDFHDAIYPSRAEPYFSSGRLIAGAMIPFLLVYAYALERIGTWANRKSISWILLGLIVGGITIWELTLRASVLTSPYNFFHMF